MEHAKLSASGSHRWINCPGSVKAEEGLLEITTSYAEEGILAHTLASHMLSGSHVLLKDNWEKKYPLDPEMFDNLKKYTDYVFKLKNLYGGITKSNSPLSLYVEQKVDFSETVPGGFGTADVIIIAKDIIHIIDLKYGQGVKVEAENNTQLLLYAIGALSLTKEPIEHIMMHIVQPRLDHISHWGISISELDQWKGYLKAKAEIALHPNAPRIPSEDACRWCKAKSECPALYNFTKDVLDTANSNDKLSPEQIKTLLDNQKLLVNFLTSVEQKAYRDILDGKEILGYKLVPGRNIRKLKSDSEKKIIELLGEKAYNKSLVGIMQLEKLLGDELASLVTIESCKPVLVKESDKREAIIREDLWFEPVTA
jgi:hypothetical protein